MKLLDHSLFFLSYRFFHQLKKLPNPSQYGYILTSDYSRLYVRTSGNFSFDECYNPRAPYVDCASYGNELFNVLTFLQKEEYLHYSGHHITLDIKGQHPSELLSPKFFRGFTRSVLCPIVVSIITTLITLAINGR